MMRETPINSGVSTIVSCVFPSLFPHPSAQRPQNGIPVRRGSDLDCTSANGHHVPSPEVAPTRGPTSF